METMKRSITNLAGCFAVATLAQFGQAAAADPTKVHVVEGLLSFSVPDGWIVRDDAKSALTAESALGTWVRCSVIAAQSRSFGYGQDQANLRVRQYPGPSLKASEKLVHEGFEERNGVSIYTARLSGGNLDSEIRQFYLADGDTMHVISATCFFGPDEEQDAGRIATSFYDAMTITPR